MTTMTTPDTSEPKAPPSLGPAHPTGTPCRRKAKPWPHPFPKSALLGLALGAVLLDQGVSAEMRARIVGSYQGTNGQ